jgi:hypothetical protein
MVKEKKKKKSHNNNWEKWRGVLVYETKNVVIRDLDMWIKPSKNM